MAENESRLNDVGTVFTATIKEDGSAVDISTATVKQIIFLKPGGDKLEKTAVFVDDGTDGQIKYVSVSGDLDELGTWQWQALVTTPSGSWHTSIRKFRVRANL